MKKIHLARISAAALLVALSVSLFAPVFALALGKRNVGVSFFLAKANLTSNAGGWLYYPENDGEDRVENDCGEGEANESLHVETFIQTPLIYFPSQRDQLTSIHLYSTICRGNLPIYLANRKLQI